MSLVFASSFIYCARSVTAASGLLGGFTSSRNRHLKNAGVSENIPADFVLLRACIVFLVMSAVSSKRGIGSVFALLIFFDFFQFGRGGRGSCYEGLVFF